ncbi:FAD binding domain-containing protein [Dactylosporangium aurantiacum]|uniref:FAD binding domain-containing protein n=1 Tax=Dactylosporangium aurantiacum TaxID=35754 RepID=A0A9Q9IMX4_9ACTN|nr:FAD binding domain-containing protein [Dactylosporangium aurantiacum]MDG6105908.1 FAD binding domain-containing protein [Dactylosporangium aurantiacum]UWZ57918.1 FAD binding domain-containing protein [Dactylosporangium aurantiacum]
MKPPAFGYVVAHTAGEAVDALADGGTQVLAGGQSLVLELNHRAARPARLVDINRVPGFDRLTVADGGLRVGPLVRHSAFADLDHGPLGTLLGRVVRHIAHPPIRARGTMLGSLAYAHPAAEWAAVATALDGRLVLTGAGGTRIVAAEDFSTGPFATVRRPDELLTEVRLALLPAGTGVGFAEHRRTHASFAQLAALATLTVRGGRVGAARVGLVNAADRPVRARAAERVLLDRPLDTAAFAEAGRVAATEDADPRPQPYADVAYQRHAVAVLVRRALDAAHRDLTPTGG